MHDNNGQLFSDSTVERAQLLTSIGLALVNDLEGVDVLRLLASVRHAIYVVSV